MFLFNYLSDPFMQRFCIYGLFGYKDIEINFDESYKILVGENGSGKTTILNCLYYTLKKKFEPLSKIRFDKIKIDFGHKKILEFEKYEVEAIVEAEYKFQNTAFYRSLSQQLTDKDIDSLTRLIYSNKTELEQTKAILTYTRKLGFDFKTPSTYMYKNVKKLVNEYLSMNLVHRFEVLDEVLKSKILYFPTYRRVESAFANFEEINKKLAESNPFFERIDFEKFFQDEQMQFGMEDVYNSIHKITSEIYRKTMDGFGVIMGDMLSQLSKNVTKNDVDYDFDKKVIKIILDRLGDTIKEEDKLQIMDYANSGNLNNSNLNFLISKLAKLYDEQKGLDKALKVFKDTCNHYLFEKRFVYNESAIDLHIESSHNQEKLDLECLSSGEKQIVSLFAKLFLDVENTFIMLLDEPELSLSVLWQEKLLPDILRSQKCNFMLAVTHSPFIYDNELENSAQAISDFIKEKVNG